MKVRRFICPTCQTQLGRCLAWRISFSNLYRCTSCGELFRLDLLREFVLGGVCSAGCFVPLVTALFGVLAWRFAVPSLVLTLVAITYAYPYFAKALPADASTTETLHEWLIRTNWFSRRNYWRVSAALFAIFISLIILGTRDSHQYTIVWIISALSINLGVCMIACFYGLFVPFGLRERKRDRRRFVLTSRWSALFWIAASACLCCHFVSGSSIWTLFIITEGMELEHLWLVGGPCFALLGLSAFTFLFAIRKHKAVIPLCLLTVALATVLLWYDVSHDRWQIAYFGRLDEGGGGLFYFTWWWYG